MLAALGVLIVCTIILWQVRYVPGGLVYLGDENFAMASPNGEKIELIEVDSSKDRNNSISRRWSRESANLVRLHGQVRSVPASPREMGNGGARIQFIGYDPRGVQLVPVDHVAATITSSAEWQSFDCVLSVPKGASVLEVAVITTAGDLPVQVRGLEMSSVTERGGWKICAALMVVGFTSWCSVLLPRRLGFYRVLYGAFMVFCFAFFAFPRVLDAPRSLLPSYWTETNAAAREIAAGAEIAIPQPRVGEKKKSAQRPRKEQHSLVADIKKAVTQTLTGRFFLHLGIGLAVVLPFALSLSPKEILPYLAVLFLASELIPYIWYHCFEWEDALDLVAYALATAVGFRLARGLLNYRWLQSLLAKIHLVGAKPAA